MVVTGLVLVIPGDAIHSWTWHQNGLTVPTPGTNPDRQYGVRRAHDMGMNFVMLGTLVLGIARAAPADARALGRVAVRARVPRGALRVSRAAADDAERRAVALRRADGRVRVSGRARPRPAARGDGGMTRIREHRAFGR